MCGRFFLFSDDETLQTALPGISVPEGLPPRYNIAPGQPVAVVPNAPQREMDFFLWGLVPSWAKDPGIGNRLINARAETVAEKPSFRAALRRRRCLILADGFFEWYQEPGAKAKTPLVFQLASGLPFAFAGLWEVWYAPDGSELRSCTIITTEANALIAPYHARMPVILHPADFAAWLNPEEVPPATLTPLLRPYPPEQMLAYPVSTLVNNIKFNSPDCIKATGLFISVDQG